jgi:hypothetical protein
MKKIVLLLLAFNAIAFGSESNIMENATSAIVVEVSMFLITVILAWVGKIVVKWLNTNRYAKKYLLQNGIDERTVAKAVMYAESAIRQHVEDGVTKKQLANKYIDTIDPKMVHRLGDKLDIMIDRKVGELFHNPEVGEIK